MLKILITLLAFGSSFAAHAQGVILDSSSYQRCEAEAFISLIIARNAMHANDTRESLLAVKGNGNFQIETINEVFDEIAKSGTKDHAAFAIKKFYQCTAREKLPIQDDKPNAFICLARQDIAFYAGAGKRKNWTQEVTASELKKFFAKSSKAIYSDYLIDQVTPMVYRARTADDDYQVRQIIFQSCRFPEEWSAKYQNQSTPKAE